MARQPSCFLDRFCLLTATIRFLFFFKAPRAFGSHVRFLGAHADRTQRRRGCPSSLGTRHTEDAHHHTHPAHMHAHCLDTQVRSGARTPAGTLPSSGVTTGPEARPRISLSSLLLQRASQQQMTSGRPRASLNPLILMFRKATAQRAWTFSITNKINGRPVKATVVDAMPVP